MASDTRTPASFIIVWGIENFTYCVQKAGEELVSTTFTANFLENTRWRLLLLPRGDAETNDVRFILQRSEDDDGPESITVTYEMSVFRTNTIENLFITGNNAFMRGGRCNTTFSISRNELSNKSYLPQDCLTVRCCLWNSNGETLTQQIFARTCIRVQLTFFTWEVPNLSTLQSNQKESIIIKPTSKQFPSLTIRIFWTDSFISRDKARLEIAQSRAKENTFVVCKISVLNSYEGVVGSMQDEHFIESMKEEVWNFPNSFARDTIMYNLSNNVLSLSCECAISIGDEQNSELSLGSSTTHNVAITTQNDMVHDFQRLLEKGMLSDFEILVGCKKFNVHKAILVARSSVFAAMFNSDTKEKSSNCVTIQDLDKDTVGLMLTFIYTDVVEDLQWERGLQLYCAADKYDIRSLKQKCSFLLIKKLTTMNVCEVLLRADMHHDVHLKAAAQDFIATRVKQILNTQSWSSFESNSPQLALQTWRKIYGKQVGGEV